MTTDQDLIEMLRTEMQAGGPKYFAARSALCS